jgi:DNA-binding transcriptional ArsR family regulator
MDIFTALAEPTRRRIVEMLSGGEHAAGAIAGRFDVSPPAISQHLKTLREAGIVRVRVEGQHRFYSLDPVGLDEMDAWLRRTRRFWSQRLDILEQALRKPEPPRKTRRKP